MSYESDCLHWVALILFAFGAAQFATLTLVYESWAFFIVSCLCFFGVTRSASILLWRAWQR